jgi:hypothetical protein
MNGQMSFIKHTKGEFVLSHDVNGNLYITDDKDVYVFIIGALDVLMLMKVDAKRFELNKPITHKKIEHSNGKYGLKTKIIDNIIEDQSDDDIEEDEQEIIKKYTYKPDDKFCSIDYSSDDDDVYDEPYFKFFGICDESEVQMDISIYETVIISGGISSQHVIFKSVIANDSLSYRISIHTDGFVKFNIIGSKIKTYKIEKTDSVVLVNMHENIISSKF